MIFQAAQSIEFKSGEFEGQTSYDQNPVENFLSPLPRLFRSVSSRPVLLKPLFDVSHFHFFPENNDGFQNYLLVNLFVDIDAFCDEDDLCPFKIGNPGPHHRRHQLRIFSTFTMCEVFEQQLMLLQWVLERLDQYNCGEDNLVLSVASLQHRDFIVLQSWHLLFSVRRYAFASHYGRSCISSFESLHRDSRSTMCFLPDASLWISLDLLKSHTND